MNRNAVIALALVAVVGVGGYLAYDQVLRGDDVAPLAMPSPTAPTATSSGASSAPTASATGRRRGIGG